MKIDCFQKETLIDLELFLPPQQNNLISFLVHDYG